MGRYGYESNLYNISGRYCWRQQRGECRREGWLGNTLMALSVLYFSVSLPPTYIPTSPLQDGSDARHICSNIANSDIMSPKTPNLALPTRPVNEAEMLKNSKYETSTEQKRDDWWVNSIRIHIIIWAIHSFPPNSYLCGLGRDYPRAGWPLFIRQLSSSYILYFIYYQDASYDIREPGIRGWKLHRTLTPLLADVTFLSLGHYIAEVSLLPLIAAYKTRERVNGAKAICLAASLCPEWMHRLGIWVQCGFFG